MNHMVQLTRAQFLRLLALLAATGVLETIAIEDVAASSPPVQIFPAISAQPSGVGDGVDLGQAGVIRRQVPIQIVNNGGRWFISSTSSGLTNAAVDDILRFAVRGGKSRDLEYYTRDNLFEITDLLASGANTVDVSLVDRFGPNWGCSALYAVNTDGGAGGTACVGMQAARTVGAVQAALDIPCFGRLELATTLDASFTACDGARPLFIEEGDGHIAAVGVQFASTKVTYDGLGDFTADSSWDFKQTGANNVHTIQKSHPVTGELGAGVSAQYTATFTQPGGPLKVEVARSIELALYLHDPRQCARALNPVPSLEMMAMPVVLGASKYVKGHFPELAAMFIAGLAIRFALAFL